MNAMTKLAKAVAVVGMLFLGRSAVAQEAPRDVPPLELEKPVLLTSAEKIGYGAAAGFADLGLRAAETGVEYAIALAGALDAFASNSSGVATGILLIDLAVAVIAPVGEAALVTLIGYGGRGYGRRLLPLVGTSYASHAIVDIGTVALLASAQPALAIPFYLISTAVSSAAMGGVHALTSSMAAEGPLAQVWQPAPNRPTIPAAIPEGATFRF